MLYVHCNFGGPHGPAKAKFINHTILSYCIKTPTTFHIFQNQSDWSPEQPGNSTRHYSNFKTSKKNFFQKTGTPDSDWSRTGHLGRESFTATMKSLWKLLTLVLWVQDNFAELVIALKHFKPHNMLCQTPTDLDHRSPVKIDINKTYFSTGKTRYNWQIGTQQRLQINLFKTTTTKGHQILQSITEPKHSNHKSKMATTNNFVFTFSFSWKRVQD